jgi:hypothetical protein
MVLAALERCWRQTPELSLGPMLDRMFRYTGWPPHPMFEIDDDMLLDL